MQVKDYIKESIKRKLFYRNIYLSRLKDSINDLNKAYPHVKTQITKSQKVEILEFWNKYLINGFAKQSFDIRWFDVYNSIRPNQIDLKYYIPDGFYYCMVDTFMSSHNSCYIMDDKNLYDLYFPEAKRPLTIIRKEKDLLFDKNYNIISEDKAVQLCRQQDRIIIKPSIESCGGKGICYWSNEESDINDLKNILCSFDSMIVQEVVTPHELLNHINSDCLSTLRIVTLIFEGSVHVVSSVLIMAGKGAKTNHLHSGGLVCGILSDGHMKDYAYDGAGNCYQEHPNGIVFSKTVIPGFQKCVDLVKTLAPRLSRVTRLIGWDLTIDSYGEPILIEANMTWGGLCQIANGPIFGSLTPSILDYVAENSPYFK